MGTTEDPKNRSELPFPDRRGAADRRQARVDRRGAGFRGGRTVIWIFQNTGTRFIGGDVAASRSAARGVNKTFPPAASFAWASAQTSVTHKSVGADESVGPG